MVPYLCLILFFHAAFAQVGNPDTSRSIFFQLGLKNDGVSIVEDSIDIPTFVAPALLYMDCPIRVQVCASLEFLVFPGGNNSLVNKCDPYNYAQFPVSKGKKLVDPLFMYSKPDFFGLPENVKPMFLRSGPYYFTATAVNMDDFQRAGVDSVTCELKWFARLCVDSIPTADGNCAPYEQIQPKQTYNSVVPPNGWRHFVFNLQKSRSTYSLLETRLRIHDQAVRKGEENIEIYMRMGNAPVVDPSRKLRIADAYHDGRDHAGVNKTNINAHINQPAAGLYVLSIRNSDAYNIRSVQFRVSPYECTNITRTGAWCLNSLVDVSNRAANATWEADLDNALEPGEPLPALKRMMADVHDQDSNTHFYVVRASELLKVGVAVETGHLPPVVRVFRDDVVSRNTTPAYWSTAATNYVSVWNADGRMHDWYIAVSGAGKYHMWVGSACPLNCARGGRCDPLQGVCVGCDNFNCSARDGPFKTVYIVLLVVGAAIVLAIALGVPVYCWLWTRKTKRSVHHV
mmetsp:Transcript_10021/g.24982  ORF Transcript_10021/g.24982 Transcript_10021/m.24982 type:complete len:514 (+) Transcript_10021:22-1563(+)